LVVRRFEASGDIFEDVDRAVGKDAVIIDICVLGRGLVGV
jgi:hypothetical protein